MIEWKIDYSVGNVELDKEHANLFRLANRAAFTKKTEVSNIYIKQLIDDFLKYIKFHFKHEEEYMRKIAYPNLDEHAKLHKEIEKQTLEILEQKRTQKEMEEEISKIANILLAHILKNDILIEKWNKERLFKEIEIDDLDIFDDEENLDIFDYICKCPNMIHKLPMNIHKKIQEGVIYECKKCHEIVKLKV